MKKLLVVLTTVLILSGCSTNPESLTLKGDIQNIIISSVSEVPGKIIQMNKQQGELVKKGEIIATIDNTNQKYLVDQLQAVVDMKKAKLEELEAGTRPEQIEQASSQVEALKAQLDLLTAETDSGSSSVAIAQDMLDTAQTNYDYIKSQYDVALNSYNDGIIAKSNFDLATFNLDTAGNQLEISTRQLQSAKIKSDQGLKAAKANYDAAIAGLNLLQSGATEGSINIALADLNQSIAQLNQAQNTLSKFDITALADGIVISKNFEIGDVVIAGGNIADVAISNDIYVLCYIPDQYLDKIYYNQELSVTTSQGTQTGRVSYISLTLEYTPKDKQSTSDSNHTASKVKIAINDSEGILKSGMTAEVLIPLISK
ncbi:MAG: HlyD family secretion protein [Sedimentibacter sp.]